MTEPRAPEGAGQAKISVPRLIAAAPVYYLPGARPLVTEAIPAALLSPPTLPIAAAFDAFQLINRHRGHPSIVLMSNNGFEEWGRILGDEVMAAALLEPSGPSIPPMIHS